MRPGTRSRRVGGFGSVAAVALCTALLGAGCSSSTGATAQPSVVVGSQVPPLQETPASATASVAATFGSTAPGVSAGGTAAPGATVPPGATAGPGESAGATPPGTTIDPSLLDIIPSEVEGNQVTESAEAEASTSSDPAVDRSVARLAVAFVADTPGINWAVATVSALRPGLWGDAFFRDWRDSYDQGACAQSGGVSGHAEADIGGRHVWIGTCANGVRTYHVHIDQGDLLVSISALGDARFGEQLLGALDVPGGPATTP